jgi:DNA-binding MarR family transcriptional regulator
VRQLARRLAQHYDAEVSASGLKTTQYSLLSHVVGLGPIRPVDLAARMQMTASTLSRNVQPLIAAGWVMPIAGADGRSRLLQATAAGMAKRREAQGLWKTAQRKLGTRLGVARVAALHALIDDSLAILAPAAHRD